MKRILGAPLILLAALWLFLEEWLWDRLADLMAFLARLPAVRALEQRIAALPPYAAMTLFLVPLALLLPFKIAALWLLARGDVMFGIALFLAAKVLGTALVAWIYSHCRSSLLTVRWFAACHRAFVRFRDYIHARLAELGVWRAARALTARARQWMRSLRTGGLRRRLAALRRLRNRRPRAPS